MICNPSKTDIRTALENRKAFHPVKQNQTSEESLAFLDSDEQNFVKDSGKYILEGLNIPLRSTVTTELNKDNTFDSELGGPTAKIGNFVHSNIEKAGREILQEIAGLSTSNAISKIKAMTPQNFTPDLSSGKKLDEKSKNNIFDLAKNQILFAYEEQHIINNRSGHTAVPSIRFEAKVIDPVKSVGGTIDFLAVLSDNTFIIRDYKTKMTTPKDYDTSLNLKGDKDLIYYKSLDKYKLQIAEYARILRTYYGFAGTHSNRLIPIRVFSVWNDGSKDYAPLVSRVAGPNQDKAIDDIVPFTEKTGFESLDKFLASIDKQIDTLEARKGKDVKIRQDVQDRIDRLKNLKKEILIKKSVNNTVDHVKYLSSKLEDMESLSLDDLLEILGEFRMLESLSSATYDFKKYLVKEGKDVDEMEAKIGQTLSVIQNRIEDLKFEINNVRMVRLVEEETGIKITNDTGDFIPFAPEGAFANWFYQLSAWQNPIFKTLRSKLDKANYESRQAVDEITKEVIDKENAIHAKLKSLGKDWSYFVKIMINPKTDNFYTKGSPEFFKKMDNITGEEIPIYYEIQDWHDWQDRMNKEEARLVAELTVDGNLDAATLLDRMSAWERNNNLSLGAQGKPRYKQAWINAKKNSKLKLKDSMVEESKEYAAIRTVPEFLAYYQMFEKYNEQFRKMLGVEYSKLPNNFLANIRKESGERLQEFGWAAPKSIINDFISDFSIREDERSDDNSYLKRDSIPKFFLNPFRDKTGKLLPGEKSYQFGRSLLLFAKMAHNYDQMSKIEAEVLGLRETLVEKAEELIPKSGGIATNFLGNNKVLQLKSSDIPSTFDKFVKMYLYGISVEPIIGDKSGKTEKALMQLKNYFSLKTLGLNFIAAAGGYVSAQIQARLVGKVSIFYDEQQYIKSLVDSGRNRTNFLALNAYFDVMGHRYGNIRLEEEKLGEFQIGDTSQRGFINRYVSTRTLMQPYALGDNHVDEIITYSAAQNYYVDELGNLAKMKTAEDKIKYKDRTILALFEHNDKKTRLNLPEEQVKNVYIAFRRAVQTIQSKVKGSIPEEDRSAWSSSIVGTLLMNFKSWLPGVLSERVGKAVLDDRTKTLYMGRYVAVGNSIGNLDYNATGEKLALGAFLYKIVLPRLAQLTANVLSLQTIGGYFKGYKYGNNATIELMYQKWLAENPQYSGKVTLEEFKEITRKQVLSTIVELRLILAFALVLTLAMRYDDDEDGQGDYKKSIFLRKMASILLKTNQELTSLYSPANFASMIQNPVPFVSLLAQAQQAIFATGEAFFNHTVGETNESDPYKDVRKAVNRTTNFFPGVQGSTRLLDVFSDSVQYLNTQQGQ